MAEENLESLVLETTETFVCPRCGQLKPKNPVEPHMCCECAKAEDSRYSYLRQHQDWLAIAKDSGIEPWLRQPGETQWEYTIWCAYRDSYPGKKMNYRQLAEKVDTTHNMARKVAQRWTFPVRMQLWVKHMDEITMVQRQQAMLDMNKKHINLANKITGLVDKAVDELAKRPEELKASEVASLTKVATELERKAHIDSVAQEEMVSILARGDDDNPELKKSPTKSGDVKEILEVLSKSGAFGNLENGGQIGIRQTTEIVVKDNAAIEGDIYDAE